MTCVTQVYTFAYKTTPTTRYVGTMAQDLLLLGFNDAVSVNDDGFYEVEYELLDVDTYEL
eukprot:SAG31_NODE_2345_length_5903_cov_1.552895_1_plen_60_part_00